MTLRNPMASSILTSSVPDGDNVAPLRIRVFTSERCAFSQIALEHVRCVVQNLKQSKQELEVVEASVDGNPNILETHNIMALPLTVVGDFYILGIPTSRDLESLLNEMLRT
ncbi:MAG: hypothetical protein KAQ65_07640 [Candidatus Thorarchaeota archaeon]|nr:hypothetical protein [Candidatus Thorarchaeota archaeon]